MTHVTHPIFVTHLTHDPWPIDPFPALIQRTLSPTFSRIRIRCHEEVFYTRSRALGYPITATINLVSVTNWDSPFSHYYWFTSAFSCTIRPKIRWSYKRKQSVQSETTADFSAGAATWTTGWNMRVVFDFDPFAPFCKNMSHTQNRKYITYCIAGHTCHQFRAQEVTDVGSFHNSWQNWRDKRSFWSR